MAEPAPGIPYLRVARSLPGWWRPVVEVFIAAVWWFVGAAVVGAVFLGAADVKKLEDLSPLVRLANLHVLIALMIPAVLAAAHLMGRRATLLTSVRARMRWRWLIRCLLYASAGQAAFLALVIGASLLSEEGLSSLRNGGPQFWEIVAITVLLVPFQAAGEEFFNRGTLQQAVGAYGAPAWLAIGISTIAFTAAHGKPNTGTIVIVAMGIDFAWLTLKTGGLEASIAAHVMNNIVAFILAAASKGTKSLDPQDMNEHVGITSVIIQLTTLAIFTALTVRGFRRSGLSRYANPEDVPRSSAQRALAAANQIKQHAPERSAAVDHAEDAGHTEPLPPEQQ